MRRRGTFSYSLAAAIAGTATCAIFALGSIRTSSRHEAAAQFFSAALRTQHASETVVVGNTTYSVEGGVVDRTDGLGINAQETFAALRLAYAWELARRSPLMDLEGTDPDALRAATDKLASVQKNLAALQSSSGDWALITNGLYPISFLKSLTELERSRQAFITSGRDSDERAYQANLGRTVQTGRDDLASFTRAFNQAAIPGMSNYSLLVGTITKASSLATLNAIMAGYDDTLARARERAMCLSGLVSACDSNNLAISLPRDTGQGSGTHDSVPTLVKKVLNLYQAAGFTNFSNAPVVALTESACISQLPAPYYYAIQNSPSSKLIPKIEFVGEVIFYPDSSVKSVASLDMFGARGASYIPYIPATYYSCPGSTQEISRVETILRIAKIARDNPGAIQSEFTRPLLNTHITYEADAVRYLAAALRQSLQSPRSEYQDELLGAYVALKDNSASFDTFVTEIASFGSTESRMENSGMPIDTSTSFLFTLRSGFYDLFLADNPSAVDGLDISPYAATGTDSFFSLRFLKWSSVQSSVPEAQLAKDMNVYLSVHPQQ